MTSPEKKKSTGREYGEAIIIAIVLAIIIRTFVIQAFKIPSGSMLPTLQIGDHLLVSKSTYGIRIPISGKILIPFAKVKHNDIIVFKYPKNRKIDYIKRVIAIPGDTLEIRNKKLFINKVAVEDLHAHFSDDTLLSGVVSPRDNLGPIVVPDHKFFVMGDNRDNSHDSRFWGFVDETDILGKAFIIYWSWDIGYPWYDLVHRIASVRWSRIADIIH